MLASDFSVRFEIDVDRWTRQISCVFAKKKKKMLLTLKEEDRRKDEVFDNRKRKGNERLEFLPNVNFSKKTRKNIFPVLILEKGEWNETCTNFDPLEKF